jgi:uncharacterized membrane protein
MPRNDILAATREKQRMTHRDAETQKEAAGRMERVGFVFRLLFSACCRLFSLSLCVSVWPDPVAAGASE